MGKFSPVQSVATLLVSVEDLINMAMGPEDKNVVNFKLVQTVLHILARQMRLLEQKVEIRVTEYKARKEMAETEDIDREKIGTAERERRNIEKALQKEKLKDSKAAKDKDRAEKTASKEREKAEKAAAKDREREEKATSKESEKAERAAAKDRGNGEKTAAKDREREEGGTSKEREKAEKRAAKDREREDRATSKEREKAEKAAAKDKKREEKDSEKADRDREKAAAKEERAISKEREKELKEAARSERHEMKDKERAEKEQQKAERADEKVKAKMEKDLTKAEKAEARERDKAEREQEKASKTRLGGTETGIAVTEEQRDKDKILVVDQKGSAYKPSQGRTNIEVVTRSQFDMLKNIVGDLAEKAGPLPMPSMPQNKELLKQLSKGTASLTDMMGAMQVSARVVAAEQAIGRMGGILTQLATAGALPEDIAGQVDEVTTELEAGKQEAGAMGREAAGAKGKAYGADVLSLGAASGGQPSRVGGVTLSRKSLLSAKSKASTVAGGLGLGPKPSAAASMTSGMFDKMPKVTHPELDDAICQLKEDLGRSMAFLVAKSSATADASMAMVKTVAEKMDTALKVNSRISTLHAMVADYADQLSGFDAGLTTQLQSFGEQIGQMRGDLTAGLKLLETVNNNAETAAVMELTERYEGLVSELDQTLQAHSDLTIKQTHMGEDLKGLIESVEMLREQKADRDEVQDGLRDKADTSRLAGLLTEEEFVDSRMELERRLRHTHEKFQRQDEVWMGAINDLREIVDMKADLVQLLGTRDETQEGLEMLHEMCQNLALVLGEPKAAVLTRKLARDAFCAACLVPALMEPADAAAGAPPRLPAARPRPAGAPAEGEPCEEFRVVAPPDHRRHMCHRWVGGSHTLLSDAVSRMRAETVAHATVPTKRYAGYGNDGRLYMMEEALEPCLECNKMSDGAEGETLLG